MPIDRDATLKQAEKLLRQGKLDGAIAEYVRLVEDQPRDWNAINALGDLYVRAGNVDRAVTQFTKIADYLFGEGFFPKAAALYKKALKVKADHEHTLLRLSEIAAQQGLLADARMYLRQLGRQRRDRGDGRGAAECLVRLARLDEADAESKLAGARASQVLGETAQAVSLFKEAAGEFAKSGRTAEAVEALSEAAVLDPADAELRRDLARECVAAGQIDRARTYLTRESAGSDPDLLVALGRMELESGNDAEARSAFTMLITVAPYRADVLLQLAAELRRAGSHDRAFTCAEIVADDALLASDWDRALTVLRAFLEHGPHIPALMKLVELAVDAGRDDVMYDAQARLADAYLADGRGAEARVIAEDLVVRDPSSEAHVDRLRHALALVGVPDAESVIERYRQGGADVPEPLDFDLANPSSDGVPDVPWSPEPDPEPPAPAPAGYAGSGAPGELDEDVLDVDVDITSAGPGAPETPADATPGVDVESTPAADDAIVLDMLEIDLSDTLAGLSAASPVLPPAPVPPGEDPVTLPPDLESVFAAMRTRVTQEQELADAGERYERGLQHLEQGRIAEALADLQGAARTPLLRFKASGRLGRLYVARGDFHQGVEWLERAAEAPAPSPDEGLSVLYDLAGALERMGETARALAVLMEIDADGGGYRDVRERIERLSRAQAGSPRS